MKEPMKALTFFNEPKKPLRNCYHNKSVWTNLFRDFDMLGEICKLFPRSHCYWREKLGQDCCSKLKYSGYLHQSGTLRLALWFFVRVHLFGNKILSWLLKFSLVKNFYTLLNLRSAVFALKRRIFGLLLIISRPSVTAFVKLRLCQTLQIVSKTGKT